MTTENEKVEKKKKNDEKDNFYKFKIKTGEIFA